MKTRYIKCNFSKNINEDEAPIRIDGQREKASDLVS